MAEELQPSGEEPQPVLELVVARRLDERLPAVLALPELVAGRQLASPRLAAVGPPEAAGNLVASSGHTQFEPAAARLQAADRTDC